MSTNRTLVERVAPNSIARAEAGDLVLHLPLLLLQSRELGPMVGERTQVLSHERADRGAPFGGSDPCAPIDVVRYRDSNILHSFTIAQLHRLTGGITSTPSRRLELAGRRSSLRELNGNDGDRHGRVSCERAQVDRISGEDDRVRVCAGVRRDHGIDSGDGPGPPGCGPQAGGFARAGFVNVADLASPQQSVGMKVTTVVAGEGFGQNHRRHLCGPQSPLEQFLKSRPLTG